MPNDPHPQTFSNQTVEVRNLAVTSLGVEGKQFSNCTLVGPAFVLIHGQVTFVGCTFEDADSIVPVSRLGVQQVIGAIGMKDCDFSSCRFNRLTFLVSDEVYAALTQ